MVSAPITEKVDTSADAIERVIGWNESMAGTYAEGSAERRAHATTAAVVRSLQSSATARDELIEELRQGIIWAPIGAASNADWKPPLIRKINAVMEAK